MQKLYFSFHKFNNNHSLVRCLWGETGILLKCNLHLSQARGGFLRLGGRKKSQTNKSVFCQMEALTVFPLWSLADVGSRFGRLLGLERALLIVRCFPKVKTRLYLCVPSWVASSQCMPMSSCGMVSSTPWGSSSSGAAWCFAQYECCRPSVEKDIFTFCSMS